MQHVPEHEKLRVYARAVAVAKTLDMMAEALPSYRGDLKDQLWRASSSLALNIAEGAGEFSSREKARFYRIARRSGAECVAILDLLDRWVPAHGREAAKRELSEILAMLTTMVKVVEDRRP